MIFIIFIINIPQVSWIPWVLFDTAQFTGQVRVVPTMGMVCHGTGTVWENPTRGLPVLNPSHGTCKLLLKKAFNKCNTARVQSGPSASTLKHTQVMAEEIPDEQSGSLGHSSSMVQFT